MKIAIKVKSEADWKVVAEIARQSAKQSVTNSFVRSVLVAYKKMSYCFL